MSVLVVHYQLFQYQVKCCCSECVSSIYSHFFLFNTPMELKYQLLSILAFPLFGWIYKNIPVNGYFKCNDPSLSFKIPESGETIPTKLLFQSVLIPVFFVVSESILDQCC